MENLYVDAYSRSDAPSLPTTLAHYQPAARTLLLAHPAALSLHTHPPHSPLLSPAQHFALPELALPPLLLDYLVDEEVVLVVSPDGTIFTVDLQGTVDVKAMNEDGLAAASLSPTQDYLYLVSSNATLIQLNREYDLVSEVPLDDEEPALPLSPRFSWRADGSYFVLNYQTPAGRKAVTKDPMLATFRSPAKSDPQGGLVQSVSERGSPALSQLVAWQPSGSLVAGTDVQEAKGEKVQRVVFWEKNGLRHLEFSLGGEVQKVKDLFWSLDSAVLFVRAGFAEGEKLLCYYRANYHWFLKHTIPLAPNSFCLPMGSSHRKQRLLIVGESSLEVFEYSIRLDEKDWKSEAEERARKEELHYFVDGKVLHVTDFSKCLMPPPMSMHQQLFSNNIVATAKKHNHILVLTEAEVLLYDAANRQVQVSVHAHALKGKPIYEVRLLSHSPASLAISGTVYSLPPFEPQGPFAAAPLTYALADCPALTLALSNSSLTLGENCLS